MVNLLTAIVFRNVNFTPVNIYKFKYNTVFNPKGIVYD